MGKIVIKKRISLDFIGEEYKEAYLEFKTISLKEYNDYTTTIKDSQGDEAKSAEIIMSILTENYISGKFPDEKGELFSVTKDQLDEIDIATIVVIFKILTGQDTSPN